MPVYEILIGILFLLAFADLMVGVSNDAVNFLNSAIGSRVAPLRTILIVASAGILIGTVSSEGMMTIARNGIFQPEFFTFDKVMIIFLAVMFTDVILLDVYNTYGLPTSTTVSLIFELLGASLIVGLAFLFDTDQPIKAIQNILNYSNALFIIGGIMLSVVVAFTSGSLIHFFARLLFTFRFKKNISRYGSVFTGISLTTIFYFLIIKGAATSSWVPKDSVHFIVDNMYYSLGIAFLLFALLTEILMRVAGINPLKIIVLSGTFSLAMAFAGNDLVNFIGVSVAGLTSYNLWLASGVEASEFNMVGLNTAISTPGWILIGSGIIMVITLWTNAKSRKVTETEVSLGRQDDGDERFQANLFARFLVGGGIYMGKFFNRVISPDTVKTIDKRFSKPVKKKKSKNPASFDLLRASVNLIVASALIAFGTSKKLPLSTTFVTFMVAMGTSFADRAWGLESAVYRVSGVLKVVGGWFLTAFVAFSAAAGVALVLYFTSWIGVVGFVVICGYLLIKSHVVFRHREKSIKKFEEQSIQKEMISFTDLLNESRVNTTKTAKRIQKLLKLSFEGLRNEEFKTLANEKKEIDNLVKDIDKLNTQLFKYIRKLETSDSRGGRYYLQILNQLQNITQSAVFIASTILEHRSNFHSIPGKEFNNSIRELEKQLKTHIHLLNPEAEKQQKIPVLELDKSHQEFLSKIENELDKTITLVQQNKLNIRLAQLQMRILMEMKDIVSEIHALYLIQMRFEQQQVVVKA
jgi:phosphate/sulfate permease